MRDWTRARIKNSTVFFFFFFFSHSLLFGCCYSHAHGVQPFICVVVSLLFFYSVVVAVYISYFFLCFCALLCFELIYFFSVINLVSCVARLLLFNLRFSLSCVFAGSKLETHESPFLSLSFTFSLVCSFVSL